jgi:SAM-dependent methyltransferase
MIATSDDSERRVASIFNFAVAASAIAAGWELGLFDAIQQHKSINVDDFAAKNDLDGRSTRGLVTALATVDVAEYDTNAGIATAGSLFSEAYRSKSLFHWLTLGSGELFARMQYVLRNGNRKGDFYRRDPAAIAYACRDINTHYFDPAFQEAMQSVNGTFNCVVDLGCGSGKRLMQILKSNPGTSGIGIDLAGPSLSVAKKETEALGMSDRLSFAEGDAREMVFRDEFAKVDFLTCFMMGHDFWPREQCLSTLRKLRDAFPNARRFLLGDATRILLDSSGSKYAVTAENVPIFTLAFEFGHAMMDVYIPTIEEWEGAFTEGGWRLIKKHLIETLSLSVVFELERA